MTDFISRRAVLTTAIAAVSATPALAQVLPDQPGIGLLTVAGLIGRTNRGAVDEKEDRFFTHHNLVFSSAFVFSERALADFPQKEVPVSGDQGTIIYRGPALYDILQSVGMKPDAKTIRVMALDGFAVDLPLSDAMSQGWILATIRGGKPFAIGDRGPAYSVRPLPGSAKRSEDENQKWVHSIFYIEAMA